MGSHRAESRSRTSIKVRAVLAGALVLGVGSTMTVAAWTDTEFAAGSFSASVFDTESSIDNVNWVDNSPYPGTTTMTFAGTGMSPDTHRYGYELVRTKPNSVAGTLTFGFPTVTNGVSDVSPFLSNGLQYRVISITAAGCSATTFSTGTPTYIVGTASTYAIVNTAGTTPVTLPAATASPGAPVGYCFDVYLPAGANSGYQGKSVSLNWRITATSVS